MSKVIEFGPEAREKMISGIDKLADKVAKLFGKKDCGCNRRRKTLNKVVSYKNKK